jgi:hypothetical protein
LEHAVLVALYAKRKAEIINFLPNLAAHGNEEQVEMLRAMFKGSKEEQDNNDEYEA